MCCNDRLCRGRRMDVGVAAAGEGAGSGGGVLCVLLWSICIWTSKCIDETTHQSMGLVRRSICIGSRSAKTLRGRRRRIVGNARKECGFPRCDGLLWLFTGLEERLPSRRKGIRVVLGVIAMHGECRAMRMCLVAVAHAGPCNGCLAFSVCCVMRVLSQHAPQALCPLARRWL